MTCVVVQVRCCGSREEGRGDGGETGVEGTGHHPEGLVCSGQTQRTVREPVTGHTVLTTLT